MPKVTHSPHWLVWDHQVDDDMMAFSTEYKDVVDHQLKMPLL